jgi:hypothetical protein
MSGFQKCENSQQILRRKKAGHILSGRIPAWLLQNKKVKLNSMMGLITRQERFEAHVKTKINGLDNDNNDDKSPQFI